MALFYLSNEKMLQNYGAMFENLAKDTLLANELAEYGYDKTEIDKGKALYERARELYALNLKETREETSALMAFREKYEAITKLYASHRKKARVIFIENEEALRNLKLKGTAPKVISTLIEQMRDFYTVLNETESYKTALKQLKLTEQDYTDQLSDIVKAEKLYADYLQEKGESQQATKNKDMAINDLDKWGKKLYAIAKIVFEEQPQLLESIGKIVKS